LFSIVYDLDGVKIAPGDHSVNPSSLKRQLNKAKYQIWWVGRSRKSTDNYANINTFNKTQISYGNHTIFGWCENTDKLQAS
jgi:hypothetical protein